MVIPLICVIDVEWPQVRLPVGDEDSLSAKVEALRMLLEDALGMERFLKLYHHLEGLSTAAEPEAVDEEIRAIVGEDNVRFTSLVQQLISTEEVLHAAAAGHAEQGT